MEGLAGWCPWLEEPDVRALLRRLATPSAVYSPTDQVLARRLAATLSAALRRRWLRLLQDAKAQQSPLLYIYVSDGWGTKLADQHLIPAGPHILRREGKVYSEFLLQRGVLKTVGSDMRVRMAMDVRAPLGMALGKTGWHIWQGACDFAGLLRYQAPRSIICSVYVQDGLHFAGMTRRMFARHELAYSDSLAEEVPEGDPLAREKDWVFGWKCTSHVASNAVKWSLAPHASQGLLEDLHNCVGALRNSSEELMKQLDHFVATRVRFADTVTGLADREFFWSSMGTSPHVLPTVLEVNPRWQRESETLLVSPRLAHDGAAHEKIVGVVAYFLKWRDFSETRWAGVGPCLRSLCASEAVGLEYLVRMVYDSPHGSTYYLGGYRRFLTQAVREYVAVGVFSTRPAEGFNVELLHDDRFLLRAPALWDQLLLEASRVEGVAPEVWDMVSECMALRAEARLQLRGWALDAVAASLAYLDRHAFSLLRAHPWSLTQGDVAGQVSALKGGAVAEEHTTRKIQTCLRLGVPETQVVRALTLLREMPGTTGLVEKAHAAGAWLRRSHWRLTPSVLAARCFLCQVAPMLVPCPWDGRASKLRACVEMLSRQRIQYTARNHFYAHTWAQQGRHLGAGSRLEAARVLLAQHNALYDKLTEMEKAQWRREAEIVRARKERERGRRLETATRELAAHFACAGPPAEGGVRNVSSAARFSEEDVAELQREWAAGAPGSWRAGDAVQAPGAEICDMLESLAQRCVMASRPTPWWSRLVAAARGRFAGTALAVAPEEDEAVPEVIFVVALASLSPLQSSYVRAERAGPAQQDAAGFAGALGLYHCRWEFLSDSEVPFQEDEELVVLELSWCWGGLAQVSRKIPFEAFTACHPRAAAREARAAAPRARRPGRSRADLMSLLQEEFPWLRAADVQKALEGWTGAAGDAGGPPADLADASEAQEEADAAAEAVDPAAAAAEDLDAVAEELAALREEHAAEEEEEEHFYRRILGGAWTVRHRGVLADSVAAYARAHARGFCQRYQWPRQKTFAFARYGEPAAHRLAGEWVRRGNHFARIWLDAGCEESFVFVHGGAHEYEETLDFLDWAVAVDLESPVWERLMEVRRAWPGA